MSNMPKHLPPDFLSALSSLNEKARLEIEDLKLMVLLECAGQPIYERLAEATPVAEAQDLLRHNGREETAHAHRLKKAIEILTGEPYEIPDLCENPYAAPPPFDEVTAELLEIFKATEFAGDTHYQTWAAGQKNAEVAELLRQNGREETRHGERVSRVAELLSAGSP